MQKPQEEPKDFIAIFVDRNGFSKRKKMSWPPKRVYSLSSLTVSKSYPQVGLTKGSAAKFEVKDFYLSRPVHNDFTDFVYEYREVE